MTWPVKGPFSAEQVVGAHKEMNPYPESLFVPDALVLVLAAVHDATGRSVALKPGLPTLEFAACSYSSDAVTASCVLSHR